jgi:hypothetical protein
VQDEVGISERLYLQPPRTFLGDLETGKLAGHVNDVLRKSVETVPVVLKGLQVFRELGLGTSCGRSLVVSLVVKPP